MSALHEINIGEFGARSFPAKPYNRGESDVSTDETVEHKLQQSMNAAAGNVLPNPGAVPIPNVPTPVAQTATPQSPPGVPPQRSTTARSALPVPGLGNIAESIAPTNRGGVKPSVTVNDAFEHDVAFKLSFLGTGQGGGRIADAFWSLGYRRVGAVNTNQMDFSGIAEEINKLDLAVGGAAKDAAFAEAQLEGREDEVWDLLTRSWGDSTDYGLICAGLGGGTGSGTVSKLVKIGREYLKSKGKAPRVGVIVSLPTVNEGQLVCRNAINTFRDLMKIKASPILIIDNAKINELYRPAMSMLHETANVTVSKLLHLFNSLCEVPESLYTFDRSELAQLLDGGIVVMGAAAIENIRSPADISTAIRDELSGNVLAKVDIRKGKKGCCLFVANQKILDALPEEYFAAGFDQLERNLGSFYKSDPTVTPVVHRGLTVGEHEGVQAYIMVSELAPPVERLEELARKANISGVSNRTSMAAYLGIDDAV